ncbi:MAG: peptidylprolyl isomerase [Acidobacteriota bacterium]|nr:peptidylprolyl isomerase [Acidobacteriota bacterium]
MEEIQEKLAEEMSRFPSTEAWLESLRNSGLSREERKEEIRLEALFFKYQDEVVAPEVMNTVAAPEMVRGYYDKYRDEIFLQPRQVHLLHLMRSVARDAPEEERLREKEVIDKARARIVGGESFEDVARELSSDTTALKGGDLGWINENAPMIPELKEAVLELEEGQLSGVLESPPRLSPLPGQGSQAGGGDPFRGRQGGNPRSALRRGPQEPHGASRR